MAGGLGGDGWQNPRVPELLDLINLHLSTQLRSHNLEMAAKTADELSKLALNGTKDKATNPSINGTNGVNGNLSDQDDSDDDNEDGAPAAGGEGEVGVAKKKKKNKKKKSKKKKTAKVQSDPPRVPLAQLFPNGTYPVGEEVEYKNDNAYRTTSEEKRHLDRMNNDFLQEYRKGAEIHRQVRKWANANIKPGMGLTENRGRNREWHESID